MLKVALNNNVKGIVIFAVAAVALFFLPMLRAQVGHEANGYREDSIVDYGGLENADLDEVIEKYHEKMNEEVNRRIGYFVDATEAELSIRNVTPAREKDGILSDCPAKNVSTFCLARFLADEYGAFREELLERRRDSANEARKTAARKGVSSQDLQELIKEGRNITGKIDREFLMAEKTIDMTLSAYHELHLAWPLHKKYEVLIDSLASYREQLASLRDSVELFPDTFRNVSTTQCT